VGSDLRSCSLEKLFKKLPIAEGFRAAGASSGKCSGFVAAGQARRQVGAAYELMQKAGVEAVASTHCIDGDDWLRWNHDAFGSPLRHRSLRAEFYYDHRHQVRQLADRGFQVIGASGLAGFALVGQEYVNMAQDVVEAAFPFVVGIVV